VPEAAQIAASSTHERRRGELTAERVLDVAEALFAERGYSGTTLRDVAARVGIRTPSLYNHFASKDALYAAVLERGIGPLLALLRGGADGRAGGRPDSGRLVTEAMALLARRPNLPRLVLHETLQGGRRLTPLLRDWMAPTLARARELVETDPAARRWAPEEIPLLVLALYHVVVGYFAVADVVQALDGEDLLSDPALARQTAFLRRLVETLLPDETPPSRP
jgi:AcrR family transcriptional regulator